MLFRSFTPADRVLARRMVAEIPPNGIPGAIGLDDNGTRARMAPVEKISGAPHPFISTALVKLVCVGLGYAAQHYHLEEQLMEVRHPLHR